MKINQIASFIVKGLLLLGAVGNSSQIWAQVPVTVTATAMHYGGNIRYTYQVTNNTRARSIVTVSIGNAGHQGDIAATITNEQPELTLAPYGAYWGQPNARGDHQGESALLGGVFSTPPGWKAAIQQYEESDYFSVDWGRDVQVDPGIRSGQTFTYGVTVPLNDDARSQFSMLDPAYLNGHFTVGFAYSRATDEGPSSWDYTGNISALDTIPPTLTVTLTPNTLLATNQLYPITANISVTDNYDPQPEIKLESIVVSEVSGAGDIVGATLGTDDRQFQLLGPTRMAIRGAVVIDKTAPVLPPRIYTVTYSAMDGSGNKTLASVTIPVNEQFASRPCVGVGCPPKPIVTPATCVGFRPCPQATPVVTPPPPPPRPVKRPWWKFW